jgi:hypothetical protein
LDRGFVYFREFHTSTTFVNKPPLLLVTCLQL